jgi:hypothetical protein
MPAFLLSINVQLTIQLSISKMHEITNIQQAISNGTIPILIDGLSVITLGELMKNSICTFWCRAQVKSLFILLRDGSLQSCP